MGLFISMSTMVPDGRARVALVLLTALLRTTAAEERPQLPIVIVSVIERDDDEKTEPSSERRLRVFVQALLAPEAAAVFSVGALGDQASGPGGGVFLEPPPSVGEQLSEDLARELRDRGLTEGFWIQELRDSGELLSLAAIRFDDDGRVRAREVLSGDRLRELAGKPSPDFAFVPPVFRAVAVALGKLRSRTWRDFDVAVAVLEADRLAVSAPRAEASARALAVRFAPESAPHRIVAQCLRARGEVGKAIDAWRLAVVAEEHSALCRFGLASALAAQKKPVEAVEAFDEVLRLVRASPRGRPASDEMLERRAEESLTTLRSLARQETERLAAWERARGEVRRALRRETRKAIDVSQAFQMARERADSDPDRLEVWIELGEQQQARGLYSAASVSYERALAIDPRSRRALERLAVLQILSGRYGRSGLYAKVERTLADAPSDPVLLVLLGDAFIGRSESGWRPERWSEFALGLLSLQASSYSLTPPSPDAFSLARQRWERAGELYRLASERFPGDARARARYADWLLHEDPQEIPEALALEGGTDYADLYRVEACRLLRRGGDAEAVDRLMERFLEHASRRPLDVIRVVRRWLSAGEPTALTRATRFCEAAIERSPFHAGLRECRAGLALRRARRSVDDAAAESDWKSAAADLRYALASGDQPWQAIEKAWENPPVGQRSVHPPFSPPGPARAASSRGAPRSFPEFLRLRCELAATLLKADRAWEAFAELRPLDDFLDKEKRRLRGTRRRELGSGTRDAEKREQTRPDSWRDEPVDFGNDRERLLWSRHALWMGHALRGLEDRNASRKRYRWAARCLAVRDGAVLEESRWEHDLSPRAREFVSEALAGLALVSLETGSPDDARSLITWIRRLGGASETLEELERELAAVGDAPAREEHDAGKAKP